MVYLSRGRWGGWRNQCSEEKDWIKWELARMKGQRGKKKGIEKKEKGSFFIHSQNEKIKITEINSIVYVVVCNKSKENIYLRVLVRFPLLRFNGMHVHPPTYLRTQDAAPQISLLSFFPSAFSWQETLPTKTENHRDT